MRTDREREIARKAKRVLVWVVLLAAISLAVYGLMVVVDMFSGNINPLDNKYR